MKYIIDTIAIPGPDIYNINEVCKYLTIGMKYTTTFETSSTVITPDLLDNMMMHIKDSIMKSTKNNYNESSISKEDFGIISLTDKFFDYIRNNDTKIQVIRVSLTDYEADNKEQRLKTLKTKMMVVTADDESMDDIFDTIVKELYYQYGDSVIDLYSIILTPKQYKIINNIPVEYRGVLIRVKK